MLPVNLLHDLRSAIGGEVLQTLLRAEHVRIERIVSHGQASPADFWYDQAEHEWVLLLQGAARLIVEDIAEEQQVVELRPGDALMLKAHARHRVDWTTPDTPTVWLAVHFT